jgi:hypothetical protein
MYHVQPTTSQALRPQLLRWKQAQQPQEQVKLYKELIFKSLRDEERLGFSEGQIDYRNYLRDQIQHMKRAS